jgi:DNA-binding transcriptional ArsR family regulator
LRALAHPIRIQMVGLLRKRGPLTATRVGESLGINSGSASYHLRQLAAAGFIEEDTERGNARERWWRPVHAKIALDDTELTEREPEAALGYLQSVATAYATRVQYAVNAFPALPRAWRDVFNLSDWLIRLAPEQAAALRRELAAVIARYQETGGTAPNAEDVVLIMQVLPDLGDGS